MLMTTGVDAEVSPPQHINLPVLKIILSALAVPEIGARETAVMRFKASGCCLLARKPDKIKSGKDSSGPMVFCITPSSVFLYSVVSVVM